MPDTILMVLVVLQTIIAIYLSNRPQNPHFSTRLALVLIGVVYLLIYAKINT